MRDHLAAPDSAVEVTNLTNDEFLTANAKEIRTLGKRVVGDVIEIGRRLTECRAKCGHGNWLPWLDRELGWQETTALRFIRVFELQTKSGKLLDLDVPVSGLYLLAAPSTPEEVRTEMIGRAVKGEKVSHKEVKEAVGRARSAKVSTTKSAATVQPEQPERKDVRDEAPLSPAPATGTDDGLILLGCLRAFDRQGLLGHDPGVIVRGMPVHAAKDVHRLAPTVASWLNRIKGPASPIGADEPQFPRRSEPGTMLKKT